MSVIMRAEPSVRVTVHARQLLRQRSLRREGEGSSVRGERVLARVVSRRRVCSGSWDVSAGLTTASLRTVASRAPRAAQSPWARPSRRRPCWPSRRWRSPGSQRHRCCRAASERFARGEGEGGLGAARGWAQAAAFPRLFRLLSLPQTTRTTRLLKPSQRRRCSLVWDSIP
eukprot:6198619-Pleurochrysis_carterae.AAC.4